MTRKGPGQHRKSHLTSRRKAFATECVNFARQHTGFSTADALAKSAGISPSTAVKFWKYHEMLDLERTKRVLKAIYRDRARLFQEMFIQYLNMEHELNLDLDAESEAVIDDEAARSTTNAYGIAFSQLCPTPTKLQSMVTQLMTGEVPKEKRISTNENVRRILRDSKVLFSGEVPSTKDPSRALYLRHSTEFNMTIESMTSLEPGQVLFADAHGHRDIVHISLCLQGKIQILAWQGEKKPKDALEFSLTTGESLVMPKNWQHEVYGEGVGTNYIVIHVPNSEVVSGELLEFKTPSKLGKRSSTLVVSCPEDTVQIQTWNETSKLDFSLVKGQSLVIPSGWHHTITGMAAVALKDDCLHYDQPKKITDA